MVLPPQLVAAGITLDNTLGVTFLGLIGASFLFGITTLQMYLYYHRFRKDSSLHKISVGVLWTLDAFHLSITIHAVYTYLVTDFGDIPSNVLWSLKVQILINVIIILLVQALYAYRVWLLGGYHHGLLGYLVAAIVLGGFVIGVVLAYQTFLLHTFSDVQNMSWAVYTSFGAATFIDFVIAAAMCYYLRKSKGVEMRLNSSISRVMQYTLSSGLLTSACSLFSLFAYAISPNTLIYLGIDFLLTKLYVGSFLAMLNARYRADDDRPAETHGTIQSFALQSTVRPSRTLSIVSPKSPTSDREYPWDSDPENISHPYNYSLPSPRGGKPIYIQEPEWYAQG